MEGSDEFGRICRQVDEKVGRCRVPIKSSKYPDAEIFTIYGQDASPLERARYGLRHIEELAYTVAEHHPYWRLLSGIAETARITLDKWDDSMTSDDIEDASWSVSGMADALNRMK